MKGHRRRKESRNENGQGTSDCIGRSRPRYCQGSGLRDREVGGVPSIRSPGVTASTFRFPFLPWAARVSLCYLQSWAGHKSHPPGHHSQAAHEAWKLPSMFLEEQ